jgi:hypothetical protein
MYQGAQIAMAFLLLKRIKLHRKVVPRYKRSRLKFSGRFLATTTEIVKGRRASVT